MHNLKSVQFDPRERKLEILHQLQLRLAQQARGSLCADNTAAGRQIAKLLDEQADAIGWAIDEIEADQVEADPATDAPAPEVAAE